jgi:O-antigen ligase
MEGIVIVMVCASPWVYGAVHPGFEFLLNVGLGLVLVLWGVRIVLEGQLTWKRSPVTLCLAGLFLLGIWQTTPLPRPLLKQIAPGTAALYDQLLPQEPEVLPDGEEAISEPPAGSTLSLYPEASRGRLMRLLALFLLFAAVTNNTVSPAAFTRLCVACLVNGALLALFALVQRFTAHPGILYWTYPSAGNVFGPFINRNHFALYLNLCIGLGVAFVLSRAWRDQPDRGAGASTDFSGQARRKRGLVASLSEVVHDSPALWACAAVALMLSSVALCLSRGGLLALAGGSLVCGLTVAVGLRGHFRLGTILVIGLAAVAVIAWLGAGPLWARLVTLGDGQAAVDRLPLWSRVLPIARHYPLWGTGYGTFEQVEVMYRPDARDEAAKYHHAHNDYLELLLEGGVFALGLCVLAIGLVYLGGWRALCRHRIGPTAGLAAGGLFAFTTLVIHSFGEFGTHIPAVTVLAAVLAAQLCALASPPAAPAGAASPRVAETPSEYRLRLGGLAPCLAVVTALAMALLLCGSAWRGHMVWRLKRAAAEAGIGGAPDDLRRRATFLEAAAALTPGDAYLQFELGYVCFKELEGQKGPKPAPAETLLALRSYLRARDQCPVMSEAHLGIAAHVRDLRRAEDQGDYLRRAKLLAPADPTVWFTAGLQELAAHRYEQAWASWRHSLELTDGHLAPILTRASTMLSAEQIVAKLLPDRPEVLLAAATRRHWQEGERARLFCLRRALACLEANPTPLGPRELRTKAKVHVALGQAAQAEATYRQLTSRGTAEAADRCDFARFLYDQGRLGEARRELLFALAQEPTYYRARELLDIVTHELARKG